MQELDDDLYDRILELSEEGNHLADADSYEAAHKKFEEALDLVPNPKIDWEASLWLYASIGDMYFFLRDYENATENFYNALNCPDGKSNAFVHLRLGESLYELRQDEKSIDHLLRAYMLEGKELFADEEEKYFKFLSKKVELE
jgi:tetratricopeptide (TPR) repeat protein